MKKKRTRQELNKHMKDYWSEELPQIQACIMESDVLSSHILERLEERNISIMDLATALMRGEIIEGFDTGQYPKYRNPDPTRTIKGIDSNGRTIIIGVAITFKGAIAHVRKLTTVYVLENNHVENPSMDFELIV